MMLPPPLEGYNKENEAQARRAVEMELARVNAQLQSIIAALAAATTLPITVR